MDDIKDKFHQDMLNIYERAKSETSYRPTSFLTMVTNFGGVETAHRLLATTTWSDGFTKLWELKRLDLSMELLVLQSPYNELFSDIELDVARKRLLDVQYNLPQNLK